MSLLAGIKFIPKGERKLEPPEQEEKRSHKEKKHSKKRKHEKETKKEKTRAKKEKREQNFSSSDENSDEDKNEPTPKSGKHDWRQDRGNEGDDEDFDFSELMKEDAARNQFRNSSYRTNYHEDYEKEDEEETASPKNYEAMESTIGFSSSNSVAVPTLTNVSSPTVPVPAITTNKSIADLLRNKLKSSNKAIDPTEIDFKGGGERGGADSETTADVMDSMQYSKEYMLLKSQYTKLHQAEKGKGVQHTERRNLLSSSSALDEDNIDKIYSSNILKMKGRFKDPTSVRKDGSGFNEEEEVDSSLYSLQPSKSNRDRDRGTNKSAKNSNKHSETDQYAENVKRQIQESIKDQNRLMSVLQSCQFCASNPRFPRHLILAASDHLVLRLKSTPYSLAPGHMELIPKYHCSSYLQCDEETQREIVQTLSALQAMFSSLHKSVVITETALRLEQRPHCVIEAVPVDRGVESEVQICVREAFLSCDEEWSTHKKIIELSDKKGLGNALPAHFPYCQVSWLPVSSSKVSGYVHPVENESSLPHSFCFDILAGVLEEEVFRMRRGKPFSESQEREEVLKWQRRWKEFDWNK